MSDDDDVERRASDTESGRGDAARSFHAVLHEQGVTHDCRDGWIDDGGWDRIPAGLLAAGWDPPSPDPYRVLLPAATLRRWAEQLDNADDRIGHARIVASAIRSALTDASRGAGPAVEEQPR